MNIYIGREHLPIGLLASPNWSPDQTNAGRFFTTWHTVNAQKVPGMLSQDHRWRYLDERERMDAVAKTLILTI